MKNDSIAGRVGRINDYYIEKVEKLEKDYGCVGKSVHFRHVCRSMLSVMHNYGGVVSKDPNVWEDSKEHYFTALRTLREYLIRVEKNPEFKRMETNLGFTSYFDGGFLSDTADNIRSASDRSGNRQDLTDTIGGLGITDTQV